jgi:hypothetical protein
MTSDNEIRHEVQEELDWDPQLGARDFLCVSAPRCKRTLYFPEELQSALRMPLAPGFTPIGET